VANSHGSATSSNATLTVLFPPSIVTQPSNLVVTVSSNVSLMVSATGTGPLSYHWYYNGTALADNGRISGALTPNLQIANFQISDGGNYQAVVANGYGMATSSLAVVGAVLGAPGVVRFVSRDSANPTAPYSDWSTAGQFIQDALNVSSNGDFILVSNGVFQVGSTFSPDGTVNRFVAVNAVTIQSLNGPGVTVVDGGSAMRCGWLTNGVVLSGFTLTNGSGTLGGGLWCASTNVLVLNCSLLGNTGSSCPGGYGGGAYSGTFGNCIFYGNSAGSGGGAYGAALTNCTLTGNSASCGGGGAQSSTLSRCLLLTNFAQSGGGAFGGSLDNCVLNGNSSSMYGGGATSSTMYNCALTNNYSGYGGGGVTDGSLYNCVLDGNRAYEYGGGAFGSATLVNCLLLSNTSFYGGGAYGCTLYNCKVMSNSCIGGLGGGGIYSTMSTCLLAGNSADQGGGAFQGSFYNCTFIGNTASSDGGGEYGAIVTNCIIYYNSGNLYPNVWPTYNGIGSLGYCCTTPLPAGIGNFTNAPLFVDLAGGDYHLMSNSPCINAGINFAINTGTDLDGNPRLIDGIVDIGAYEYPSPGYIVVYGQPHDQTVAAEQTTAFVVTAASSLPLSYQWQFAGTNLPGATDVALFLYNVQSNNAGLYDVVISNSLRSVTSSNAMLTVTYPPPNIISQPTNFTVIGTSNAAFSLVLTSPYPTTVQWRLNGTNLHNGGRIAGATNTILTISNVHVTDAGSYQAVVTDKYGYVVYSQAAILTVLAAPGIATQPLSHAVPELVNASISVTATGAPPLFYRWQKNKADLVNAGNISGADTPILTITNPQPSDDGQYSVIVSNWLGTVGSSNAVLTVTPIYIWGDTFSPISPGATNIVAISAGGQYGETELNMVLRGDGTVVAWGDDFHANAEVPPDTTNVVAIAAGDFHGLALRQDGTVVGWGDTNVNAGASTIPAAATNIIAIAAGHIHSLALRQDGTVLGWGDNSSGQLTPPANATNIIAISAGAYFSLGLKQDGTVVGWGNNFVGQTTPPPNATNIVAIAAGVDHAVALRQDGSVIGWGTAASGIEAVPDNATNMIAIAAGAQFSAALRPDGTMLNWGMYSSGLTPPYVSNVVAISARAERNLVLLRDSSTRVPPGLWRHPQNTTVPTGGTLILSPLASGSLPLAYQWYFNGAPLSGQTNNWLALVSIATNQAGGYQVAVTNNFGAVTSQVAIVSESPGILTQPAAQFAFIGSNATFSVAAIGIGPLGYQWYLNGAKLMDSARVSGASTPSLTIARAQVADAGNYTVVVTNAAGVTVSSGASLTVASQPASLTVLQGSNAVLSVTATGPAVLAFQWLENALTLTNGGRITGATNSALTISGSQIADSGGYQIILSGGSATMTSSNATLTVLAPAAITAQPVSQAALIGQSVTFSAAASGSALGYQWFFNGSPLSDSGRISGSATPVLTITNLQPGDTGGYTFLASNSLSAAASSIASLTVLTSPGPSIRYVSIASTNPAPPYLAWSNAAVTIQDAIDAAVNGDLILVGDGLYQTGGRVVYGSLTNRVAINKALAVQSVNGPGATIIRGNRTVGNSAMRCAYLTNNASLIGFTLTGGATRSTGDVLREQSGGGAWCEPTNCQLLNCMIVSNSAWRYGGGECFGVLSNCVIAANTATNYSLAFGGGAYQGRLDHCALSNNIVARGGGGAYSNLLNNSVLSGNSVIGSDADGGGANGCVLSNCVLSGNVVGQFGGGAYQSILYNCMIISNNAGADGGGADSCVVNNSSVIGNNSGSGGGTYSCVVNNSRVIGNTGYYGGGANSGTLNNCLVFSNHAMIYGGGALSATLNNCTVVGNTAYDMPGPSSQSGVVRSAVKNSIIYSNAGLNYYSCPLTNCCTTPMPTGTYNGGGNFTNDPIFVNVTNDFHLQQNSPCINSGRNSFATNSADLDGNPRVVGGTVDIGAYEFQPLGRDTFNAWLQQYGLLTDGSATYADPDHDGLNNLQEWIAGTTPTNPASALRILSATPRPTGVDIVWQSVSNRAYFVERSSDLTASPPFNGLATNLPGQPGITTYTDSTATGPGPYFYRVGILADTNHLFTPFSVISYAWLQRSGLPTDGTVDFVDSDGDSMNNWQEWKAGTNPTDAASALRMIVPPYPSNTVGVIVSWQSVAGVTYFLQRSTDLLAQPSFITIRSNIVASSSVTTVNDTPAPALSPLFYRVGVQ